MDYSVCGQAFVPPQKSGHVRRDSPGLTLTLTLRFFGSAVGSRNSGSRAEGISSLGDADLPEIADISGNGGWRALLTVLDCAAELGGKSAG